MQSTTQRIQMIPLAKVTAWQAPFFKLTIRYAADKITM